jgi:uncharacterized protein (TIGR03437 family)
MRFESTIAPDVLEARGTGYSARVASDGAQMGVRVGADRVAVIRLDFAGARRARAVLEEPDPGQRNYLIGPQETWRTDVKGWRRILFESIYPKIGVAFYGRGNQLEYDFILGPGADPGRIRMRFAAARSIKVDANGDLLVNEDGTTFRQRRPVAYQEFHGTRSAVVATYVVGKQEVRIQVGPYDREQKLVIDPEIVWATFFGGEGTEHATAIAVDGSGNVYITGHTSSVYLPVSLDAYQKTCGAADGCYFRAGAVPQHRDAFVAKLSADGSRIVWATYLGGQGPAYGTHIAVNRNGFVCVAGRSESLPFPFTTSPFGPTDIWHPRSFVAVLSPDGSGLVYSTLLHPEINGLAFDDEGNATIAAQGLLSDQLPTTQSALSRGANGRLAGPYIAKLNSGGSALLFSTFFGGSGADTLADLAVDAAGAAYITGQTNSLDFPTTDGAFERSYRPMYVAKIDTKQGLLVYSTFLGGTVEPNILGRCSTDQPGGIAVDASGSAYVYGCAHSADFPIAGGSATSGGGYFALKLDPEGSRLDYSTLLSDYQYHYMSGAVTPDGRLWVLIDSLRQFAPDGTTLSSGMPPYCGRDELGLGMAADAGGNLYMACWADFTGWSSPGAAQKATAGDPDAYVVKVRPGGGLKAFPESFTLSLTQHPSAQHSIVVSPPAAGRPLPTCISASSTVPWIEITSQTRCNYSSFDGSRAYSSTILFQASGVGLSAGVYEGSIRIEAPGADDSPLVVPVSLTVTDSTVSAPYSQSSLVTLPEALGTQPQCSTRTFVFLGFQPEAVTSSAPWLRAQAQDDGVVVTCDTTGLAAGAYSGDVVASGNNMTRRIPVVLFLQGKDVWISSRSLLFNQFVNREEAQTADFTVGWEVTDYINPTRGTFTVEPLSEPWLRVEPSSGVFPGKAQVTVNPAGLSPGMHRAVIRISTQPAAVSPLEILVTLVISDSLRFQVNPTSLSFDLATRQERTIRIESDTPAPFTAQGYFFLADGAVTTSVSGTLPATITVVHMPPADPGWDGRSDFATMNIVSQNARLNVPISIVLYARYPEIAPGGVVNAASFVPGPVAPGSIISVFGTDFAPSYMVAAGLPPKTLNFVHALIGSQGSNSPMPIYGVTQELVNAQVPNVVVAPGTQEKLNVAVSVGPWQSAPTEFAVVPVAPGIFLFDIDRAAALNEDRTPNGPATPARVGERAVVYCTGQGKTNPEVWVGYPAPSDPPARMTYPVKLTVGGKEAEIDFAGLTPGQAGLCQVDFRVPDLPPGDHSLVLTVNGIASNAPLLSVTR